MKFAAPVKTSYMMWIYVNHTWKSCV